LVGPFRGLESEQAEVMLRHGWKGGQVGSAKKPDKKYAALRA